MGRAGWIVNEERQPPNGDMGTPTSGPDGATETGSPSSTPTSLVGCALPRGTTDHFPLNMSSKDFSANFQLSPGQCRIRGDEYSCLFECLSHGNTEAGTAGVPSCLTDGETDSASCRCLSEVTPVGPELKPCCPPFSIT